MSLNEETWMFLSSFRAAQDRQLWLEIVGATEDTIN